MRKHASLLALGLVVVATLIGSMIAYQVKTTDAAVVETFGRLSGPIEPGLHFKYPWPVQRVITYDKSIQHLEDIHEQTQTRDNNNLLITAFVWWRIEDPVLFRSNVGDRLDRGEGFIRDMARNAKKEVVGRHDLEEFVSTDPGVMKLKQIEGEMLANVQAPAMQKYGIRVLQIGVKRLALPEDATKTVMENMRKDRDRIAQDFRTKGENDARAITSDAESVANTIVSFARRKAGEIMAQGDAEAGAFYSRYKEEEGFAMFLRRLDVLKDTLKTNSVFVMDGSLERAYGYFSQPPTAKEMTRVAAPSLPDARPASPSAQNARPVNGDQ